MTNSEIGKIFSEISEYLEMQEERSFRSRAYARVAQVILDLEEELGDIYKRGGLKALKGLPSVGEASAFKIEELLKTNKLKYYEDLKKKSPIKLDEMTRVEGLGPKSIKKLYEQLGVFDLDSLEKAARAGKIRDLPDFGEKTEQNILDGIAFLREHATRLKFGDIVPIAMRIEKRLRELEGVESVTPAGSFRRRKETVGDLDFLVVAKDSEKIMEAFVNQPEVDRVLANGPTKSSIRLRDGIDVDLRVVPRESYGAALTYFTGSKEHNVRMREIAQKKGMKLNEYSLLKGEKVVAGETEEGIYKALGLYYVEPEMREDRGEMELAKSGKLPKLIEYGAVRGDLQVQSDWTDGADSIETLAKAAMKAGLEYIAITDHTKSLAMTGGLDEKKLRKQMAEIDKLNKKLKGKITILKGSECDILKDGSLDLPDSVLKDLDIVGISVHSHFKLDKNDQMARLKRAMENPYADILFHPTGRLINKRPPIEIDIEELVGIAKETGTILEINALPERLDLKDEYVKKCTETGVKMSIDSDAHATVHFGFLDFGVAVARRGWAEKGDIINAWPLEKCLSFTKHGRENR